MSRYSLRALLVGVAFVAVAIVAAMNANRPWATATEVLVYLLLATAVASAFCATGERRAFWIGFAVFGWGLWLAGALWNHVGLPGARWSDRGADSLYDIFQEEEIIDHQEYRTRQGESDLDVSTIPGSNPISYRVRSRAYVARLHDVTRCLLVIVAGMVGGAISAWMSRPGRKDARPAGS